MPGMPLPRCVKDSKLTGRWRPRAQRWTGKMILQVQVAHSLYDLFDESQRMVATEYEWHDASPYEMMLLAARLGKAFNATPPADSSLVGA